MFDYFIECLMAITLISECLEPIPALQIEFLPNSDLLK